MRLKIIVAVIALILSAPLFSQTVRNNRIEAEKIAFFTNKLDLSAEEAQKFWPVYNDYSTRKEKIIQERNGLMRYLNQNSENLSDEEFEESGDKLISYTKKEAELSQTFHKKFKEVLPPAKVVRIYSAEIQFRTMLLNKLQQRREQQAPRRRLPASMK